MCPFVRELLGLESVSEINIFPVKGKERFLTMPNSSLFFLSKSFAPEVLSVCLVDYFMANMSTSRKFFLMKSHQLNVVRARLLLVILTFVYN